ncbi:hypothetical protein, partial [Streptomyces sp. WM6386]|uniref:hypothetical protein n=1 Tax=Streptomyces sp. WM6386 TaxID=1415558 RepID=UPI000619958C
TLLHLGQSRSGRERLRGCQALVTDPLDGPLALEYVILAAGTMILTGEHALARATINTVLTRLRADGAIGLMPFALYVSAYAEAVGGRMEAARAAATDAVDLADFTNDEFWQYLALSALTYVEAIRGDVERCREHGLQAIALRRSDTDYPRDASEALGLLELSLGNYEEAIACFRDGARSTPGEATDALVDNLPDVIEARIRSGEQPTGSMLRSLDELTQDTHFALHAAMAWR